MLLWGFATVGLPSRQLFDAALDRMMQQGASNYTAQGLSMVSWALAKARMLPHEDAARMLAEASALQVASGASAQAAVSLVWSFATLK